MSAQLLPENRRARKKKPGRIEIPDSLVLWVLGLCVVGVFVWAIGPGDLTQGIKKSSSEAVTFAKADARDLQQAVPEGDDQVTRRVKEERRKFSEKISAQVFGAAGIN